ncbi:MAG: hypothetical protein LC797_25040, partial [Chloroflexi bacterium]|nr:hypothetical protein [Chloroflexota bacterium]
MAVAACAPPQSGVAKPSATAQPSGAGAAQPTSGSAAGSGTAASLAGTVSFWYLNSGPVEAVADAAHRLEAKYPGVKVDTQSLQN